MSGCESPHASIPTILWAQNTKEIFITVNLSDVSDKKIEILPQKFSFQGKSGSPKLLQYAISFDLFGQLDPDSAKDISTDRIISYKILKKVSGAWPSFLLNKSKPFWLKTDFAHFVDVEESDSEIEGVGGNGQNFQDMLSMMGQNKDLGEEYDDDGNEADADSDDNELVEVVQGDISPVDNSEKNTDKLKPENVTPESDSSKCVSTPIVDAEEANLENLKKESTEDIVEMEKVSVSESPKVAPKVNASKSKNKKKSKGNKKTKS